MPTLVNKLIGTLHLGDTVTGVDMEAQVSTVGYPQTVTRDSPVTVLTGDIIQAAGIYSWQLTGTVLLDLTDSTGVYYFVNDHQGEELEFSFAPIGDIGPTITGTIINDGWNTEELNAGAMVTSKFAWPVQGQVTRTPPAGG